MSGFDRIKPPEKRLLQREETRQPDSRDADPAGRAGLFSTAGKPTTPGAGVPTRATRSSGSSGAPAPEVPAEAVAQVPNPEGLPDARSPLHVECQHCGITAAMPLTGALKRALPLVVVAPWRSHPVFATCPCGERRTWLKPKLGLPR